MRVIKNSSKTIETKFGFQNIIYENIEFRLNKYIIVHEMKEYNEVLLYNTMTGEIIAISKLEYEQLMNNTLFNNNRILYDFLRLKWYLIPKDYDEHMMIDLLRNKYYDEMATMNTEAISRFTILPTTACNAKCNYCFEAGFETINMNDETAVDVANYLIKNAKESMENNGNKLRICWFGGEPMVNFKAMTIIIDKLNEEKIPFTSTMLSNGYLLDESKAKYLRDVGKLIHVQITIDGIGDVYKTIKNYNNNDNDPLKTVGKNIIDMLNLGIKIGVRLNVGTDNKEDLIEVVKYCKEKILPCVIDCNKKNLTVYTHILFDNCGFNPKKYTEETLKLSYQNSAEIDKVIRDSLKDCTIELCDSKLRGIGLNSCMISTPTSALIYPDGSLGKCEHQPNNSYSSIYSDYLDVDYEKLLSFKYLRDPNEHCYNCELYPICLINAKCGGGEICSPKYIERELDKYHYYLEKLYYLRHSISKENSYLNNK